MATNVTLTDYGPNLSGGSEISATFSAADQVINPNSPPVPIASISAASPGVITTVLAHGLVTGDHVIIVGSTCAPTYDGDRTVTVTGTNTFTGAVNTTGAGGAQGTTRRTQTTVTADLARTLLISASDAATSGMPQGTYEKVGLATFRRAIR